MESTYPLPLTWSPPTRSAKRLTRGLAFSLAAHSLVAGLAWWGLHRGPAPIVAELDLSLTASIPASQVGGGGKPAPQWKVSAQKSLSTEKTVPRPAEPIPTMEEVKNEDQAGCVGDNCAGTGAGDGAGQGGGVLINGAQAARAPRWIRNFITSADYPRLASEQGKDGRVVLSVVIDESGRVRDAALLQGAYPALNEVALRKVRAAVFSPAYNADMRAVPCRVTLPIRFQLR